MKVSNWRLGIFNSNMNCYICYLVLHSKQPPPPHFHRQTSSSHCFLLHWATQPPTSNFKAKYEVSKIIYMTRNAE